MNKYSINVAYLTKQNFTGKHRLYKHLFRTEAAIMTRAEAITLLKMMIEHFPEPTYNVTMTRSENVFYPVGINDIDE